MLYVTEYDPYFAKMHQSAYSVFKHFLELHSRNPPYAVTEEEDDEKFSKVQMISKLFP